MKHLLLLDISANVRISALISCRRYVLFGICRRGRGLAEVFGKTAYLFPDLIFIIVGRTGSRGPRPKWGGSVGVPAVWANMRWVSGTRHIAMGSGRQDGLGAPLGRVAHPGMVSPDT